MPLRRVSEHRGGDPQCGRAYSRAGFVGGLLYVNLLGPGGTSDLSEYVIRTEIADTVHAHVRYEHQSFFNDSGGELFDSFSDFQFRRQA